MRILGLVRRRVGHGERRAIGHPHSPAVPEPFARHLFLQLLAHLPDQLPAGFLGELLARGTIGPGLRRTGVESLGDAPGGESRHGIAARMIGAQALREEHPNRRLGRVNPTLPK